MFSNVYNEAVYSNSLNLLLLSFLSFQMEVEISLNFFIPKGSHIIILLQIACVAGGIVSAREIKFWTSERRSREENGERDSEIPPARKLEFF